MTDVNNALFQHLIEGIKDYAIFMISTTGTLVSWNPGVERLLGYTEDQFIGRPFSLIFTDEDVALNVPEAELNTVLDSGKAEDERWHRRRDGTTFWASGLVTLMKAPDGAINGFAKIMRDQTQKKQFEERLAEQANALAIANSELSNFAGVLSHDLKAPLQSVQGFANVLQEQRGLDQEAKESIHYILDGTKRMINLVDELLDYSIAAKSDEPLCFVDAAEVLQEVMVSLHAAISSKGATIHATTLPTVWSSPIQLGRIFQNLIDNGIKYSAPGRSPELKVTARENENETVFSIEDNGIGIEEKNIVKLFTMHERLHTDREIPGQGIGLSTCRKLVEGFGGRMWVRSKPGQGSVFSFTIPHPADSQIGTAISEVASRSAPAT